MSSNSEDNSSTTSGYSTNEEELENASDYEHEEAGCETENGDGLMSIGFDAPEGQDHESMKKKAKAAALDPEALKAFEDAEKRKGVVYMSRIPPFMKPIKVRHLLSQHADIGRIYLAPEDKATQMRRIRSGGNKKVQFTEGWIEFLDKRQARAVVALLNNTPMGRSSKSRKSSFYAYDLWNLKFLPHFKWHHLTEKIAYENKIKASKLRAELAAAKKEAEGYLAKVDQAKGLTEMRKKRIERGEGEVRKVRRVFKQQKALPDATLDRQ